MNLLQADIGLRLSLDEPVIRYGLLSLFALLTVLIAVRCALAARQGRHDRASTRSAVREMTPDAVQEVIPSPAAAVSSDATEPTATQELPAPQVRYVDVPLLCADTAATLLLVPTDSALHGDMLHINIDIHIDASGGY